jgi:hypothetical protein
MRTEFVVLNAFREQVKRNIVALISLLLALASLSYNTWRNELTEYNRNVRAAGFEMLLAMGEVHQIVFFRHYDGDEERGNPRAGWAKILLLKDLAAIMPAEVETAANTLLLTWSQDWAGLGQDEASAQRISDAIDGLRDATLHALAVLR